MDANSDEGIEEVPMRRPKNLADPHVAHFARGHAEYRSWCTICVESRGREDPHVQRQGDGGTRPHLQGV